MRRTVAQFAMAIGFALSMACAWPGTLNGFELSGALVPEAEIHRGGPPRDGIPAIDRPRFVPSGAARFLRPADRILGLARNGVAKAYPVAILNWHEIVNDRLGDEAVLVTYCPLCGTGMAFRSVVNGRALAFRVSGLLYNSDVLFYDRETASLWSQLGSRAISGPMRGTRLEPLAVSHTTWTDWRTRYPRTLVLSTQTGFTRDYSRNPYAAYEASDEIMFPVNAASRRFPPKELVVGVRIGDKAKAYAFSELARIASPVRDRFGGQDVVVRFDATHRTASVTDTAGTEIPSTIAFWFAWYAFNPEGEVYVPSGPGGHMK